MRDVIGAAIGGTMEELRAQRELLAVDLLDAQLPGYRSRRGKIRRSCPGGAIIRREMRGGVMHMLHATKAWRSRRVAFA